MNKIRVLIVDDSALVRAALTKILSQDNEIEVLGTAPDAYIAKEKIIQLNPDVITLDIEMPGMDGLSFLEKLMKVKPLPVIMISTCTSQNSEKTIRALSLGAVDFIEKPSSSEKLPLLANEVITKVKNAAKCSIKKPAVNTFSSSAINVPKTAPLLHTGNQHYGAKSTKLILIGASTGGTMAIETIIRRLPQKMPGIVIVQHMPPNFTKAFAERLDTLCQMYIKEAEDGDIVCDNTVYIAPGGMQCYITKVMGHYTIRIIDDPPVNKHKPSVDALFLSAAQFSCKNNIGVILTGMGKDGAQGMLALKESGSHNLAQDEKSSIVFGMPKEAISIGAVHETINLDKIADRLINLTNI